MNYIIINQSEFEKLTSNRITFFNQYVYKTYNNFKGDFMTNPTPILVTGATGYVAGEII